MLSKLAYVFQQAYACPVEYTFAAEWYLSANNNHGGQESNQIMYATHLFMNYTQYFHSNELLIICVLDVTSEDQI